MASSSSPLFKLVLVSGSVILLTASLISNAPPSATKVALAQLDTLPKTPPEELADFRQVAKKAIPAVVSVKVQSNKKSSTAKDSQSLENYFDFFGNDLWGLFSNPRRDVQRSQPFSGQASGVIVHPDGYIITNSHVVDGMDNVSIQLHDGREFPAKVLGADTNSDLAVVKIEAQNLPYLVLGDSDNLEVGQWVAAIGNPFGLQATLTAGVVSAKSRNNLDIAPYEDFIQTDAAINRGNSGGPLLTLNGQVIGINTAIATNASAGYMGIGFAIPSNMARHVFDEVVEGGGITHGFLGLSLQPINHTLAQAFNLQKIEGALVANVIKDSPAQKAGVQVEDIILRYNDRPVENAASLRNAIYMMKPGSVVNLTILRKDQQISVPVTIGNLNEQTPSKVTQKNGWGIEVENLTPELGRALGETTEQGIVITQVNPGSFAALAGLKKGALILAVNREKIANVNEFYKAIENTPMGRPVLLQIKQDGNYLFISLQM